MIGNDIIDLALAGKESNWKRKGFLDKLFTSCEQQIIFKAKNAETMVWNLWSRKEAAYKIYNRQTKIRAFIPKQIKCTGLIFSDKCWFGEASIDDKLYHTKTEITKDYIYTIAVINPEDFNRISTVNSSNIVKDYYGIPFHFENDNPVSISHHGRFERKIQLDCDVQPRLQFEEKQCDGVSVFR